MSSDIANPRFPAGLRVLVVDDDPLCLRIVEKMLKRCQYEVTTFTRGADALKTLRERRHDFDIVLSDVHMPDMDGFKLLEHIALELDVPVMMMSANCATDVVLRGIIHGAVDYLLKPVRIEELRNIWQHVVRKKRGGEGGADGASAGSGEADAASEGSLEGSRGARNAKTSSGNVARKGTKGNGAGSPGRSNGTGEEPGKKRSRKSGLARDDDTVSYHI